MTNHPVVLDVDGEELVVGDRVRSTNAETKFTRTMTGHVAVFRTGPPVVGVLWDHTKASLRRMVFWHGVDLMWRCPDLQKIKQEGDALDGN